MGPTRYPQTPVVTTDVATLAYTMDGSTKVYNAGRLSHPPKKSTPTKTTTSGFSNGKTPRQPYHFRSTNAITSRVIFDKPFYPSRVPSSTGMALKTRIGYTACPGIQPGAR